MEFAEQLAALHDSPGSAPAWVGPLLGLWAVASEAAGADTKRARLLGPTGRALETLRAPHPGPSLAGQAAQVTVPPVLVPVRWRTRRARRLAMATGPTERAAIEQSERARWTGMLADLL
eukprot:4520034-Lingulodinium_polyedra.AAC.1